MTEVLEEEEFVLLDQILTQEVPHYLVFLCLEQSQEKVLKQLG